MRGTEKPVADFYGFLQKLPVLAPMDKSRFARVLGEGQESGTLPHAAETRGKASICPDCQYCGDKHSFSEPKACRIRIRRIRC